MEIARSSQWCIFIYGCVLVFTKMSYITMTSIFNLIRALSLFFFLFFSLSPRYLSLSLSHSTSLICFLTSWAVSSSCRPIVSKSRLPQTCAKRGCQAGITNINFTLLFYTAEVYKIHFDFSLQSSPERKRMCL